MKKDAIFRQNEQTGLGVKRRISLKKLGEPAFSYATSTLAPSTVTPAAF